MGSIVAAEAISEPCNCSGSSYLGLIVARCLDGTLRMASREVEEADAERLFLSVGYAPEKAEYGHMPHTKYLVFSLWI